MGIDGVMMLYSNPRTKIRNRNDENVVRPQLMRKGGALSASFSWLASGSLI